MAKYLEKHYGYKRIAFADPIYFIAREFFGMTKKDKALLQQIGQKMREIDPEVWIRVVIQQAYISDKPIVISDLRQKNELEAIVNENFMPLCINTNRSLAIRRMEERDGLKISDLSILDNESENQLREYQFPTVYNDTTKQELFKQVDEFMVNLGVQKNST